MHFLDFIVFKRSEPEHPPEISLERRILGFLWEEPEKKESTGERKKIIDTSPDYDYEELIIITAPNYNPVVSSVIQPTKIPDDTILDWKEPDIRGGYEAGYIKEALKKQRVVRDALRDDHEGGNECLKIAFYFLRRIRDYIDVESITQFFRLNNYNPSKTIEDTD